MKYTLLILLTFITVSFNGLAECAGSSLTVFPYKREIKKSSIFILEGYAQSQDIVIHLNAEFPIYLKSGDEEICLIVLETHIGQYETSQAVLRPEKPLTPGKRYQLVIDHLPKYEKLGNINDKTGKYDPITYFVLDEDDQEVPQWIQIPKESRTSSVQHNCGPSVYITFDLKVQEQSQFLIKTTIQSVGSGKEAAFYIRSSENTLSVGHGMCSGAFDFKKGESYQAKFSIVDSSGNTSEETEWMPVTNPID